MTATGQLIELDATRSRWTIGSNDSCDIVLDDPFVSQRHCVLERRASGALVVRDSRSRNGTFLDGHHVEGAEVGIGTYLSVGRTTLVAVAAANHAEPRRAIELLRGRDPAFRKTLEQALRAAQTECSVLIVGETGTGKDLLARAIHEASRRTGRFVAVNCGAIPKELIGSELFGHAKGAFTGAHDDRDGYFVEAHDGTLFLDEMGELPIEQQPHLLRALEQKRIRPVGAQNERAVDVRIVAATNRSEGLGTESGRLRVDLYHRLATVVLVLPPLRERMADLPELVTASLDELEPEYGAKRVSEDGWRCLAGYAWPGNVRELRHAVARAVALGGKELGPKDFFPDFGERRRMPQGTPPAVPVLDEALVPYQAALREAMEQAIATHGSIRAAASSIGMPKSTFADKAKVFGIVSRGRRGRPTRDTP